MSSDVRACVWSRWGPGCWVKGCSASLDGSCVPRAGLSFPGAQCSHRPALPPAPRPPRLPLPGSWGHPGRAGPTRSLERKPDEGEGRAQTRSYSSSVRPRPALGPRALFHWRCERLAREGSGDEERGLSGPRLHSGRSSDPTAPHSCCQVTIVHKMPTGSLQGADSDDTEKPEGIGCSCGVSPLSEARLTPGEPCRLGRMERRHSFPFRSSQPSRAVV